MSQIARFGVAYVARSAGPRPGAVRQMSTLLGKRTSHSTMLSSKTKQWAQITRLNTPSMAPSSILGQSVLQRGFHSNSPLQNELPPSHEPTLIHSSSGVVDNTVQAVSSADPHVTSQAMMQIGDLAQHGLETWPITRMMEYALEFVHVSTGLPWWATIALLALGVRAACLPLAMKAQKHMVGVNRLKPEVQLLTEQQREAARTGNVMASSQFAQKLHNIYAREGVSPFKGMGFNLVPLPFMMGMFFAIKDMTKMPAITHMDAGGLFWFTDLTMADPYYILPIISCIGMTTVMEITSKLNGSIDQSQNTKYIMRGAGVLMTAFIYDMPSGVFIFWIVSNILSLAQALFLHSNWFHKTMGIKPIEKAKYARKPKSVISDTIMPLITGKSKKSKGFKVMRK
ncbi:hypothetical protein GGI07_005104 [Coemansia sp. Benny D115]|nr:hypothetical protein GGI07_005104 [Coemansia sp. Benny D115]